MSLAESVNLMKAEAHQLSWHPMREVPLVRVPVEFTMFPTSVRHADVEHFTSDTLKVREEFNEFLAGNVFRTVVPNDGVERVIF